MKFSKLSIKALLLFIASAILCLSSCELVPNGAGGGYGGNPQMMPRGGPPQGGPASQMSGSGQRGGQPDVTRTGGYVVKRNARTGEIIEDLGWHPMGDPLLTDPKARTRPASEGVYVNQEDGTLHGPPPNHLTTTQVDQLLRQRAAKLGKGNNHQGSIQMKTSKATPPNVGEQPWLSPLEPRIELELPAATAEETQSTPKQVVHVTPAPTTTP